MENQTKNCENCEQSNIWKTDYCFNVQDKTGKWVNLDRTYFVTGNNAQQARIKSQNRLLDEVSNNPSFVYSMIHPYLENARLILTKDASKEPEKGSISLCPISLDQLLEVTNKKRA